jgi:hypothetical protein
VATSAPDVVDVLEALSVFRLEVLGEFRALRVLLERDNSSTSDQAPTALLQALATTLGEWDDLPFSAAEVVAHAVTDYELSQALTACRVRSVGELGALFRALRDRHLGELRLVRDGRSWRLART